MVTAGNASTITALSGATSSLAGVAGGIVGGIREDQASRQNAEILEQNAKLALRDAAESDVITALRVDEIRNQVPREQGRVASSFAARGLVSGTGTALDLEQSIELEAERQVLQEMIQGRRESTGLREEARSLLFQGKVQRFQGKSARDASIYEGITGTFATGSRLIKTFAPPVQIAPTISDSKKKRIPPPNFGGDLL